MERDDTEGGGGDRVASHGAPLNRESVDEFKGRIRAMRYAAILLCLTACTAPPETEAPEEADVAAPAASKTLIRLSPDGPEGVGLTGEGSEREHIYYQADGSDWVSAGVWEAQPYESGPDVPGYSEFMYFLDGSVTLVDASGREETFEAGDVAFVPRGVSHHWKQPEVLRKYWVIFDEGEADDWSDRTAGDTFLRFETKGPEGELTGEGRTREHTYYAARGEKLSAGVWEADPSTSEKFHEPDYTELMAILEGSVTIVDETGHEELVEAGDVVIVPKGMRYQWKQPEYVRKYWVIFDADD